MTQQTLDNHVVLITGANQGIGKALSLLCAELGAEVILVGKNIKALEAVFDEIVQQGNKEPAIFPINLMQATPEHLEELQQNIESMFGRLDILINNAAITGPLAPIALTKPSDWQQVIQLNLNVPFLLTHYLLPLLSKASHGKILFPIPEHTDNKAYWGAYNTSKAGIIAFAESLQRELSNSTTDCSTIPLPPTRTNMILKAYPGCDPEQFNDAKQTANLFIPYINSKIALESICVS